MKLLDPVVLQLHLQVCLMYLYIDGIFHAQVSASQAACTSNLSLYYHFRIRFVVNRSRR